jgi:hypothetical protein
MGIVSSWSTTAASNNSTSPDGFPEGMASTGYNDSAREMMAAIKTWWNQVSPTVIAAGTADAMTLTYSPAPAAYVSGMTLTFYKDAASNTGAATLNVNALGAKAIVRRDGSTALSAADMVANALYTVSYDGTSFRLHSTGIT